MISLSELKRKIQKLPKGIISLIRVLLFDIVSITILPPVVALIDNRPYIAVLMVTTIFLFIFTVMAICLIVLTATDNE